MDTGEAATPTCEPVNACLVRAENRRVQGWDTIQE